MIPIQPCKCGRDWAHCFYCGAKGVYVRSRESEWLSDRLKKKVTSFKCKSCGYEFDTTMECSLFKKVNNTLPKRKETAQEIAKRFDEEGRSQAELIAALTEAGYVVTPQVTVDNPVGLSKEELAPPEQPKEVEIPISIEDILSASKKNKEIL